MRKKLFLITLSILCLMPLYAAEYGGCVILRHGGVETYFEGKDAQSAMNAAVEGDTLMFSEVQRWGVYPHITMNKKVYILSSGYLNIDIDIPGNPSLDECLFQTYRDWNSLTIKCKLQKLYLCDTYVEHIDINAGNVGCIEMERCWCGYINLYNNAAMEKIVANNCFFWGVSYDEGSSLGTASFTNCRFESTQINVTNADFTNCILHFTGYDYSAQTMTGCKFTKCLMDSNHWLMGDGSSQEDCYSLDSSTYSASIEYLTTNKYFGTDNTVVGEYGGANPYRDGRILGPSASVNLNKKGNRMSPEVHISGANE